MFNERLERTLSVLHGSSTRSKALGAAVAVLLAATAGSAFKGTSDTAPAISPITQASEDPSQREYTVPVETVGAAAVEGEQPGTSWPGEVISSGDMDVQPRREGTISQLTATIGQAVERGQTIGRLAAAPIPELTATLVEQARSVAEATAELDTRLAYADRRRSTLAGLRSQIQSTAPQFGSAGADPSAGLVSASGGVVDASGGVVDASGTVLAAAQRNIQFQTDVVRDSAAELVRAVYPVVTGTQGIDPLASNGSFGVPFRQGIGELSPATRAQFSNDLAALVQSILQRDAAVGDRARQFLNSADALLASSVDPPAPSAATPVAELSSVLTERRAGLVERLDALASANAEAANATRESASASLEAASARREAASASVEAASARLERALAATETTSKLTEIEQALLDVDQELALARGRARAAQTAYASFNDLFGTDIPIVAPQSGVVSAAFKKAGDFVAPGDPVVSINSGTNRTVRFRIPGNATPPKPGEALSVIRPGFSKDPKKLTLTGVGGSLDQNGSLLADADFVEPVDWPIHGSVRVLPPTGSAELLLVSLGAVSFDDEGRSRVWVVGTDDRLESRTAKTGRSVGDKIEILDGVSAGTRIVSTATEELRAGLKLPRAEGGAAPTPEEPAGDGHDHEHP